MLRMLRILPLTLALAALSIFAMSCGSSSNSSVRFVHAVPDGPSVDIAIDGKTVETAVGFDSVAPSTGYLSVASGVRKVEVRNTGTTNDLINTSPSFNSGTAYTVVATGVVGNNTVVAQPLTDDNSAPQSGNIKLRIIHASPSGPTPVDIYVVAPGTDITSVSPTISSLAYQSASSYLNIAAATWEVIVTPAGLKARDIDVPYTFANPNIRTLVLVDVVNGGSMSATPLLLQDN